MHTQTRLSIVAICLALCAPASGLLVARLDRTERQVAAATLHEAIATAADQYRSGMGVQLKGDKAKDDMRAESRRLALLRRRELGVRAHLSHLRAARGILLSRYGTGAIVTASGASLAAEKDALENVMRHAASISLKVIDLPLQKALGVSASVRDADLLDSAVRYLRTVYDGRVQHAELDATITAVAAEQVALKVQIQAADQKYVAALDTYTQSQLAMESIKATVTEVHDQVLALQSKLSAIDDKLRRSAARTLIAKGLLEPGEIPSVMRASAPVFAWPVVGSVTAGFHEESYADHFGIPHEAIDIGATQGTPVMAAADGIVFLARDGGATGYSYLLIGHQGGFATLYGHVSEFEVTAGDQVTAGQVVAMSGGTPGTHGAGPMTTGSHLHFEVIQDGVHIDPRTVLP